MDSFLKHWFSGFCRALDALDENSRTLLLTECGKACSDSYTKQIYLDAYTNAESLDGFFDNLKQRFSELGIKTLVPEKEFEITYTFCACDLVKTGFIKSPLFCECSRQSLLYNFESVFGKGNVDVKMLQTLLSGGSACKFIVSLSQNG